MPTDISGASTRTLAYHATTTLEGMRPLIWMSIVPCVLTLVLTRLLPSLNDAIEITGLF